jgi:heat shock protein HtpX
MMLALTALVNWYVIYVALSIFCNNDTALIGSILFILAIGAFAISPIAEAINRYSFGCRKPTTNENRIIERAWSNVLFNATDAHNKFYEDKFEPDFYVVDSPYPNAYAIGRNTIAVTRGLIRMASEEELTGVLAHELGHLVYGDSRRRAVAICLNQAGNVAAWVLSGVLFVYGLLGQFVRGGNLLTVAASILALFLKACLWGLQRLIDIGFLTVGRKEEYRADDFAKSIGCGEGLAKFLERTEELDFSPQGLWAALSRTHPPTALRIDRLLYGDENEKQIQKDLA